MFTALTQVLAAFGLSGASGLNAYIPLLLVGLAGRIGWLKLAQPFDLLQNEFVIGALVVLLLIETFVDKIPAVDTINDVIQTLVRPAAGAILFASEAHVITDIQPALALILGLLVAFSVHATKATARVTVSAATIGTGNWLVSIIEDVVAFVVSLLAIVAPFLMLIAVVLFGLLIARWWLTRRQNAPAEAKPINWPR
jgi:mannitol-specific phosphotransferase system IIBC component